MKVPNGRLSGDGSAQTRRHGGNSGAVIPKSVVWPQNFVVLRKICFKHMIKSKIFSPKNVFYPPNLKTWLRGSGSAKIVSAIRIFCFEGHLV